MIKISGQRCWRLATRETEAFVTETGAHIGPITFRLGKRIIRPFAVAPWATEKTDRGLPAILRVLRGDFFCMPFGGNATPFRGERHPVHGETANAKWRLESATAGNLHLRLQTRTRPGRVDKYVFLSPGETAIYQRHVVSGMRGPMSFGHHAMLRFPDSPGAGKLSISRFIRGDVAPLPVESPADRGYSCLKPGGTFRLLEKVPLQAGGSTDLSSYPARRGFEDIVMIVSNPKLPFAWTSVTFPQEGYVWFALKDPRVLRQTVFWLSNGGRYYAPWNGRHVNVLGLEEVTSYFHYGLAESAGKNPLAKSGIPTCYRLDSQTPKIVNYIMAVAPIPRGFDCVATITPARNGKSVELVSRSGKLARSTVDLNFLNRRS